MRQLQRIAWSVGDACPHCRALLHDTGDSVEMDVGGREILAAVYECEGEEQHKLTHVLSAYDLEAGAGAPRLMDIQGHRIIPG